MSRDRAAYMREYRARKRGQFIPIAADDDPRQPDIWTERAFRGLARTKALEQRIAELEEEVRHLKTELAKRSPTITTPRELMPESIDARFNTRPFTPVPKRK